MSVPLVLTPTKTDVLSVVICAAGSMFQGLKPVDAALEQLASIMAAKNVSSRVSATDMPAGGVVVEDDLYVAASRAAIAKYQKKSNNMIAMAAARGAASNVAARLLEKQLPQLGAAGVAN